MKKRYGVRGGGEVVRMGAEGGGGENGGWGGGGENGGWVGCGEGSTLL